MSPLYTICLPELSADALAWVESIRRTYDKKACDMVGAHFTLVFGCAAVGALEQIQHVREVAIHIEPIAFQCRRALVSPDGPNGEAYVFLVPDEGLSAIAELHDRLYAGVLAPCLRLDIPFLPHITLAKLDDLQIAHRLCEDINRQSLQIEGILRTLFVGAVEGGEFKVHASIPLGRG